MSVRACSWYAGDAIEGGRVLGGALKFAVVADDGDGGCRLGIVHRSQ